MAANNRTLFDLDDYVDDDVSFGGGEDEGAAVEGTAQNKQIPPLNLQQQRLEEEQARLDEQRRQLNQERQARLRLERQMAEEQQARQQAEEARLEAERRLAALQHGNSSPAANSPGMTPVPTNTPTEHDAESRKSNTKHWILAGAALLLLVGGICGSGNCSSTTQAPTIAPTTAPTFTPRSEEATQSIVSYINSITLSGRTLSYPNDNAFSEEEALNWLIEDDVGTSATDERTLRQRFALATLWFANGPFGNRNSVYLDTWLTSRDECDWLNIGTCVGGEAKAVWLGFDGLNGQLPSDLALLTAMTFLSLRSNQLTGSIPTELGLLTALRELYLDDNQLTRSIPTELGLLTALTTLQLWNNELIGSIPTELGLLTALTGLFLFNNQLTGTIPTELTPALRRFSIYNNNVSGDMPFCDGATRPTRFARLEADCNEVSCPCCNTCCPNGGFEGIPSGGTSCDA